MIDLAKFDFKDICKNNARKLNYIFRFLYKYNLKNFYLKIKVYIYIYILRRILRILRIVIVIIVLCLYDNNNLFKKWFFI